MAEGAGQEARRPAAESAREHIYEQNKRRNGLLPPSSLDGLSPFPAETPPRWPGNDGCAGSFLLHSATLGDHGEPRHPPTHMRWLHRHVTRGAILPGIIAGEISAPQQPAPVVDLLMRGGLTIHVHLRGWGQFQMPSWGQKYLTRSAISPLEKDHVYARRNNSAGHAAASG